MKKKMKMLLMVSVMFFTLVPFVNYAMAKIIPPPPPEPPAVVIVSDCPNPNPPTFEIYHWQTYVMSWFALSEFDQNGYDIERVYTDENNQVTEETVRNNHGWANGAEIRFSFDSWNYGRWDIGSYEFTITVRDSGGNEATDTVEFNVVWDENPDCDNDGLTDQDEQETYLTDPMNEDTDYDGLNDFLETQIFETNPLYIDYYPNDEHFFNQNNYLSEIGIYPVWEIIDKLSAPSTIKVAVIDTGYAIGHEDWGDNIDLTHEKDFTTDPVGDSAHCNTPDYGGNFHGTSCAGLIGAEHNNEGIAGIAGLKNAVELMNYKVLYYGEDHKSYFGWEGFHDDDESFDDAVSAAIYQAVEDGADIISMSFGGYGSYPKTEAACDAVADNVLLIASAGNLGIDLDQSGDNHYPACYDSVMAVGGIEYNHEQNESNWGRVSIDILAPCVDIYTTSYQNIVEGYLGYCDDFGGTSSSAPMVAAVAGLLLSYDPTLSLENLRYILIHSGSESADPDHFGDTKMLDATAAFRYAYYNYWS